MSVGTGYFDVPRQTQVWAPLPNEVVTRRHWTLQRDAATIRPQRITYSANGHLFNDGHTLFTGDSYIIEPFGKDPVDFLTDDAGSTMLTAADVNLATNHRVFNTFRPTTVPGAGQDPGLLMTAMPAFQRRRAAGVGLDIGNLDADEAAFPSPVPPTTPLIPNDRILTGVITYPPNQPFFLGFWNKLGSAEDVCTFHFGGEAEVAPHGQSGGQFCVTLKSNGRAILFEWDAEVTEGDPWQPVWEFAWKRGHVNPDFLGELEMHMLFIVPYARNRIAFWDMGAGQFPNSGSGFALGGLLAQTAGLAVSFAADLRQAISIRLFRHSSANSDHRHLQYMTGAGNVRMNRPRTDRLPFRVAAPGFRDTGFIIDAAFDIDVGTLPIATHINVAVQGYTPPGTSIEVTVYDADTNVQLLRSGNAWLSNPNQTTYYCGFVLHSDADTGFVPAGQQTPVFWGYSVQVDPVFSTIAAVPVKTQRITDLNITGPGTKAVEENANLTLNDEVDEMSILRVQDQMRLKVVLCRRDNGAPLSVLFEGQTASPEATLRGYQDGQAYPSPTWHEYELRMTGLWPRLWRQFHAGVPFSFADSSTSPNPLKDGRTDHEYAPWRLTDTMRWSANRAGAPDAQLDIPNNTFRWPYDATLKVTDFGIATGTPYARLLEVIPADFLGQIWLRDPNCGAFDSTGLPTGMWRLLPNPALDSANYLFTIDLDKPPAAANPYFPIAEGALGNQVYPCRAGTFRTKPKAAEGNVVVARGWQTETSTDDGGKMLQSRPFVNVASFDPASPDWLGGETIPIVKVFEGFAMTTAALDWAARMIYLRAAFAEKWWQAVIPCPLLIDTQDPLQALPRAPRINDLLQIKYQDNYFPAVIRSANPVWGGHMSDDWGWIWIEGKFIDTAFVLGA